MPCIQCSGQNSLFPSPHTDRLNSVCFCCPHSQGYGVLSDPHLLHMVLGVLEPQHAEVFKDLMGGLL